MMASIFIGRTNDPMALSVFGVSNTILTLLFIIVIKGLAETTSIKTSYFFNNNRDRELGEYFYKGIIIFLTVYLLFILLVFTS